MSYCQTSIHRGDVILFKLISSTLAKMVQVKNTSTVSARSFEYFCRDERSVEFFHKSQASYMEAQKYFKENNMVKATELITDAIKYSSNVESVGPNSSMLSLFKFREKLAKLDNISKKETNKESDTKKPTI